MDAGLHAEKEQDGGAGATGAEWMHVLAEVLIAQGEEVKNCDPPNPGNRAPP